MIKRQIWLYCLMCLLRPIAALASDQELPITNQFYESLSTTLAPFWNIISFFTSTKGLLFMVIWGVLSMSFLKKLTRLKKSTL